MARTSSHWSHLTRPASATNSIEPHAHLHVGDAAAAAALKHTLRALHDPTSAAAMPGEPCGVALAYTVYFAGVLGARPALNRLVVR